MMFAKNKKGLVKLIAFAVIMIVLSAGLGVMLIAQSTVDDVVDSYYNSSVDAETQARIDANTDTFDFRDYNTEINIVILIMIVTFLGYSMWSSYKNNINSYEGIANFFLLIFVLAISGYLANVHTYIWSMPMFTGVEIEYSAISFYFTHLGKINLIVGILISVLTAAPKNRKETVDLARFG